MRTRPRMTRVAAALAVALLVLVSLTGCEGGAFDANDWLMGWLTTRPTGEQVANTAARTGDEAVDGILDAGKTIDEIQLADETFEQARAASQAGDDELASDLFDEAIALRPDDARYRRWKASHSFTTGDPAEAVEQWREQDRIAKETGQSLKSSYWDYASRSTGAQINYLLDEVEPSPQRQAKLHAAYIRMADIYDGYADSRLRLSYPGHANELSQEANAYRAEAELYAPQQP